MPERRPYSGNFKNFQDLLNQLGKPPLFELGNPLPDRRHLPQKRAGACPATHNEALFRFNSDARSSASRAREASKSSSRC